jgi:hypothetical protein
MHVLTVDLYFSPRSRVHGGFKKCNFGCNNVQYIKTGHYIRHVEKRHPEQLLDVMSKLDNATTKEGTVNDYCEFKTLRKSSMRSHLERHLPEGSRPKFICNVCGKDFTRPSSLRVHRQTVHEMQRKFKCPHCPETSFKQIGHLNDHIKSKHKKLNKKQVFSKRFLIDRQKASSAVPGVSFKLNTKRIKKELEKGHRRQEKVKNFVCLTDGCNLRFTARCNLLRHQKQKEHLPAEELKRIKFVCVCGEKFFSYRGYEYHCGKTKCPLKKTKNGKSIDIP